MITPTIAMEHTPELLATIGIFVGIIGAYHIIKNLRKWWWNYG